MKKILVISDGPHASHDRLRALSERGHRVEFATDSPVSAAHDLRPDAIVITARDGSKASKLGRMFGWVHAVPVFVVAPDADADLHAVPGLRAIRNDTVVASEVAAALR